jgi:nicotinate-nucleotide pyrophosphorylase (carboxylating)
MKIMNNTFVKTYYSELVKCIDDAVMEDLSSAGDHSSQAIFPEAHKSQAKLVAKDSGVLAGTGFCRLILERHAPKIQMELMLEEGTSFKDGDVLMTLSGDTILMLSLERLLLNVLQRMSGIATTTSKIKQLIAHTSCNVLDTRKTTPNFRIAEKWAVLIGGGVNHRMGLYDAIMLKDNHIDFCGGLASALPKVKTYLKTLAKPIPVIVETRTLEDVKKCLMHPWISRILLDNMSPELVRESVLLIDGKIQTEASGNIKPNNIVSYAEAGVNFISLGYLTHSAPIIDLSLQSRD